MCLLTIDSSLKQYLLVLLSSFVLLLRYYYHSKDKMSRVLAGALTRLMHVWPTRVHDAHTCSFLWSECLHVRLVSL